MTGDTRPAKLNATEKFKDEVRKYIPREEEEEAFYLYLICNPLLGEPIPEAPGCFLIRWVNGRAFIRYFVSDVYNDHKVILLISISSERKLRLNARDKDEISNFLRTLLMFGWAERKQETIRNLLIFGWNERNQAIIRIIFASIIFFSLWIYNNEVQFNVMLIAVLYWAVAWLLYEHIWIWPGVMPVRRIVAMLIDHLMLLLGIIVGGELVAPLWPMHVWVTIGVGFRFGVRYSVFSAVLSMACIYVVTSARPELILSSFLISPSPSNPLSLFPLLASFGLPAYAVWLRLRS